MSDGIQVTHRGRHGFATLSRPEAQGSSEISAQEEYESSAGRKVPRPSEQVRQQALRGLGLKAQAKDRSLRDKVVRGGGVKKKRQIDPAYKILSAQSIPQWGSTNVSLIGDSSDMLNKNAAITAKGGMGDWFKSLIRPPAVNAPMQPKAVAGSAIKGGVAGLDKLVKGLSSKIRTPAPTVDRPVTESRMKDVLKQQASVSDPRSDILGMAQQHGMKVSPWAKIVNNPMGSMLMQMAAMSAIEPIMYGMGIRSPILGGVLPFMAMQSLPGLLDSSAGIPRMKRVLQRRAERGKLGQPIPRLGQAPIPMPVPQKVASVVIPSLTTVFG